MAAKKSTKSKAKVEEEEVELEELDEETEEEDDEPAAKEDDIWGVRQLCDYVEEKTGTEYKPREMRNLLRKMARDGRIDREIIPGNKARYEWSGPGDAEVKAVVKAVKGGEIEAAKKEALDKLKADKAKKDAAKAKKGSKGKGKKAPEPDEDDEDDD